MFTAPRKKAKIEGNPPSEIEIDNLRKVVNDPIHGHFELSGLAVSIIDTPEFQRLRRLKQLGTTSFVFPGAEHTRFTHSLGVYHLAKKQLKYLQSSQQELGITDREMELVSIAGLCHDLGHGPFSHAFEEWVNLMPDLSFHHEGMSLSILRLIIDKYQVAITDEEYTFICCCISDSAQRRLTSGGDDAVMKVAPEKRFLMEIVSNSANSIDVDKFDYLKRDSHNSGKISGFDPLRLMTNCRVLGGVLCFQDKEVYNIYELFRTRYSMFRQVYGHKVSKAVEYMVMDAFTLADPFLNIRGRIESAQAYCTLTDEVLTVIRSDPRSELQPARAMIERIERRQLYCCVGDVMLEGDHPCLDKEGLLADLLSVNQGHHRSDATTALLLPEDIRLQIMKLNYCAGRRDPVDSVLFYKSKAPDQPYSIPRSQVSCMLPQQFLEFHVRVFSTHIKPTPEARALAMAAVEVLPKLKVYPNKKL